MSVVEAIILGIVQGLTEFLPVSSSGHLALGEEFFGFRGEESIAFDVLVHVATLVAILCVILRDIVRIVRRDRRVVALLVLGSVPAAIVGILLDKQMESIKTNLLLVGLFFLTTAAVLVVAKILERDRKEMTEMSFLDALVIGISQAVAILPGISRSGSTISTARALGISASSAFSFSFLLGAVAISGATVLKAKDIASLGDQIGFGVLSAAFVASLVSGIFALLVFRKMVVAGKLHFFAWYLVPLGIAAIVFHFS